MLFYNVGIDIGIDISILVLILVSILVLVLVLIFKSVPNTMSFVSVEDGADVGFLPDYNGVVVVLFEDRPIDSRRFGSVEIYHEDILSPGFLPCLISPHTLVQRIAVTNV
jgi:hypothetical protein